MLQGNPYGHFTASRGLRQGDPLAPFLFLMVSKVLSRLITRAELHNLIKGVKLNLAAPSIMHLFFANDVLLFSRAHNQDTTHINLWFETYMSWSG